MHAFARVQICRGRSVASCEAQALEQALRVAGCLDEMRLLHLLTNRGRERTIVGRWRRGGVVEPDTAQVVCYPPRDLNLTS